MKTKAVTPKQVKEMLHDKKEFALLDVREQGDFAEEHQLLACCIPFSHMEVKLDDLVPRRATRIVVVDEGPPDGLRLAEKAAELLTGFGYSHVAIMEGGINAWSTSGFELFSGVNVYRTRYFIDSGIIGTKEFVSHVYQAFKGNFSSKHEKRPRLIRGLNGVYSLKRLSESI